MKNKYIFTSMLESKWYKHYAFNVEFDDTKAFQLYFAPGVMIFRSKFSGNFLIEGHIDMLEHLKSITVNAENIASLTREKIIDENNLNGMVRSIITALTFL